MYLLVGNAVNSQNHETSASDLRTVYQVFALRPFKGTVSRDLLLFGFIYQTGPPGPVRDVPRSFTIFFSFAELFKLFIDYPVSRTLESTGIVPLQILKNS